MESVLHFGQKFGLDLRSLKNKEIQWTSFNSRGITIVYDDSSLFSYQLIPLSNKKYAASKVDAHLYTFGEDENHLLCLYKMKPILYAVDNREALPLVGMDQQTIDKLKGVTAILASFFSAENITRVESADFSFSNPLYPEFYIDIIAKSKDKRKVSIKFTSASKPLN
jgi:hypothetical protein